MAIKKDMLVEKYIEALESGTIPWEKGSTTTRLHNPITGTTYTGINRIWLTFASYLRILDGLPSMKYQTKRNFILEKNGILKKVLKVLK